MKKIILAITGASGVIYGINLLKELKKLKDIETHLVISEAASWVIAYETQFRVEDLFKLADYSYQNNQVWSPIASGSFPIDAMIICPCSMKTLSAIKNGYSNDLVARSADVCMKERRQLIICPRETPFSTVHLENMYYLSKLGVCILPPIPAFYSKPKTCGDLIEHHIMKVFDQLNLPFSNNDARWGTRTHEQGAIAGCAEQEKQI